MRNLLLLLGALFAQVTWAQQLPQFSQYNTLDYLFDPAVAGSRPMFEIHGAQRDQWAGIQDAPRTFVLSAATPLATNMGIGGYVFTDNVGPTRRTGVQFSYAYHFRVTDDIKLGMGLSFGMLQFQIDGSQIEFHDADEPLMDDQLRGSLVPDATFGLYLYGERWWFGATVPQLLHNKVDLYNADHGYSQLEAHYYAMAGYRFPLGEDLKLEPSVFLRYVDPVPPQADFTATLRYKDMLWLGLTYRTQDAVCINVGYWLKKSFQLGYSYDMTTSALKNYNSGTHEITLGVTIGKTPHRGSAGRVEAPTP